MTAWPPAERAYLVLRPPDGHAELAIGPADVQVADERSRRLHLRPGAAASGGPPVAALRLVYSTGPPPGGVEAVQAIELVGPQGQVLDGVRWSGPDAELVERACATAGLPLEWAPAGADPVPPQRDVLLRRPQGGDPRFPGEFDERMSLSLGRQQVVVVDAAGTRTGWPRLGRGPADAAVVARLRVHQYVEEPWLSFLSSKPNKIHIRHIALLGLDGQVLCLLVWSGEQRDLLDRAAAAVGLPIEYRAQPATPELLARNGVPVVKSAQDTAPMRWRMRAALLAFLLVVAAGLAAGAYVSLR
ncbi:MAG: hypothetical protein V7637_2902 [Mycobacteriales bacterium]